MRYLLHAMIEVESVSLSSLFNSGYRPADIVLFLDSKLVGLLISDTAQAVVRIKHTTVTQAEVLP